MAALDLASAISALTTPAELSIHTLSAPLLSTSEPRSTIDSTTPSLSPTALAQDLTHYKDLFSKLRFSYTEQVTKERFLKSIVSTPLVPVSASETNDLSTKLVADKAALKAKKDAVAALLEEIRTLARDVSRRQREVERRTALLAGLPVRIEELEERVAELRDRQPVLHLDPEMNLGGADTDTLLRGREEELEDLEKRIRELEGAVPKRRTEVEDLQEECKGIEGRKREAVSLATEMRKRKRDGEGDQVEMRGRWLRASKAVLDSWVKVEE